MKNLIEILKTETATLRVQFVELYKEYARDEYNHMIELSKLSVFELGETLGFESEIEAPSLRNGNTETRKFSKIGGVDFYNHSDSKKLDTLQNKIRRIMNVSIYEYIIKLENEAIIKYNNSIEKLALRIEKKGLDMTKLEVVTSHIDVNIETKLTDGNKTVRAFTIVASGRIQKPHYRYLVK